MSRPAKKPSSRSKLSGELPQYPSHGWLYPSPEHDSQPEATHHPEQLGQSSLATHHRAEEYQDTSLAKTEPPSYSQEEDEAKQQLDDTVSKQVELLTTTSLTLAERELLILDITENVLNRMIRDLADAKQKLARLRTQLLAWFQLPHHTVSLDALELARDEALALSESVTKLGLYLASGVQTMKEFQHQYPDEFTHLMAEVLSHFWQQVGVSHIATEDNYDYLAIVELEKKKIVDTVDYAQLVSVLSDAITEAQDEATDQVILSQEDEAQLTEAIEPAADEETSPLQVVTGPQAAGNSPALAPAA